MRASLPFTPLPDLDLYGKTLGGPETGTSQVLVEAPGAAFRAIIGHYSRDLLDHRGYASRLNVVPMLQAYL